MYVCVCHAVTDKQIEYSVHQGKVNSMRDLQQQLGVGTQCGRCACEARDLVQQTKRAEQSSSLKDFLGVNIAL